MVIDDILRLRQWNQLLLARKAKTPADAVRALCAVQAQDYHGATWAVAQRTEAATSASFADDFAEGKILRTHVLRPTWHFVAPEDIRWMLELTAPRVHATCRYQRQKLGLTEAVLRRSADMLAHILVGKQLTRLEITDLLAQDGIDVSEGRLIHILMYAELRGVICSGALRGKQHTYALLAERAPVASGLPREEALTRLALRYFTSHGPATLKDYAWWSGLTMKEAETGLHAVADQLTSTELDGQVYWFATITDLPPTTPTIHLLPNYDEYIVAYANRKPLFNSDYLRHLDSRQNPLFNHTVVLNGMISGIWQPSRKNPGAIVVKPFIQLSDEDEWLRADAEARYAMFMGSSG